MAQSIRISDDLYALAKTAGQALARPLAQQMEYWARIGAALDAAGLSSSMAMELLGNGSNADEFVAAALGRGVSQDGGLPMLKEHLRKEAVDVATGRLSAQSLLMFQKGDLTGYRFTPNPASEFEHGGEGW